MAKVEKLINNKTIPDLSKAFEMYNAATQQQYKKLKVF